MHTQINGPTQGNYGLFLVKHKLGKAGVRVASPAVKSYVLFNGRNYTYNPQKWSRYEAATYHFKSIRSSGLHIVCNESGSQPGLIDRESALSIVTAMVYRKPIILQHVPVFDKAVDSFMRELITGKQDSLTISNLALQSDMQLASLIQQLPARVDYKLTRQQTVAIQLLLKAHFGSLNRPVTRPIAYKLTRPATTLA